MMETYLVYPRGLRKLDNAGITARIEALGEEDRRKYGRGTVTLNDITHTVGRLEGEGLLRNMDKREKEGYKQLLFRAAREENFYWTTSRAEGELKERAVSEDFYLMSGIRNLAVLQENELFDYKRFEFDSLFEFTGTVGAALEVVSKANGWKHGFPWTTGRPYSRTISSVVTSDGAGELRIFQNDITPYVTEDPSGKRVYYRRMGMADKKAVEAAGSTECYLLVSILKYVDQLDLHPEILEKGAVTATQYVTNVETRTRTKHYDQMTPDAGTVPALFYSWDTSVPVMNGGKIPDNKFAHFIPASFGGGYNICIGKNNELVIGRKIKDEIDMDKAIVFVPEDTDNLLKSLLYQASRCLGRTPERRLLDIIDYRYSPEFRSKKS